MPAAGRDEFDAAAERADRATRLSPGGRCPLLADLLQQPIENAFEIPRRAVRGRPEIPQGTGEPRVSFWPIEGGRSDNEHMAKQRLLDDAAVLGVKVAPSLPAWAA